MSRWILQVSAGVGPIEVREFVAVLAQELAARAERLGLEIASITRHGEEEAPHSVEVELTGDARTLLAASIGTHVLVAKSSRRARRSRKRWFAGVSLHASSKAPAKLLEISPGEIEVSAARAGGPGGQHVNTTDSAVRILHKPSGLSVRVASERSQHQNRSRALERLRSILTAREEQKSKARTKNLRLSHYQFERGSAVQQWTRDARGIKPKEI